MRMNNLFIASAQFRRLNLTIVKQGFLLSYSHDHDNKNIFILYPSIQYEENSHKNSNSYKTVDEYEHIICSETTCIFNNNTYHGKLILIFKKTKRTNSFSSRLIKNLKCILVNTIGRLKKAGNKCYQNINFSFELVQEAVKSKCVNEVNISNYDNYLDIKALQNENKIWKKQKKLEMQILVMLLIKVTSLQNQNSAKLIKYCILYQLLCSGDVEKNPGPPFKKRQLCHASERERKWMHDMSAVLLKCYNEELPKSKPKNLWGKKPDHWPSSMPFYDTKNKSQDESGQVISDEDLLNCLLECCKKKGTCIPQVYQTEIKAWHSNKIQLLYKLYVLRTELENIYGILQNLLPYIDDNDLKQNLKDVKVTLDTENGKKQMENLNKDQRSKGKTEQFADITRDLAGILCRIVNGKDPEKKCDGIWKETPEGWPKDVPFFSPYNRGKSDHKCSDHKLVATLLQNSKAVIPPKYKSLVDAYKDVMKAGGKKKAKKQKETLCKLYVIQTNISKLDYVLKRLQEEGLFLSEVKKILDQWWSKGTVDNKSEDKLSEAKSSSEERPDISINISPNFIRLSVYSGSQLNEEISYCIPVNYLNTTSGSKSSTCDRTTSDFNRTTSDFTNNQLQSKVIPCVASPICHDNKLENNKTLSTASESHGSASTTILGQSHDKESDTTYKCLDNVPGTSRSLEVGSSPVISDDQTEHSQRCSTIQSTEHSQRCSTIQSTTRKRKHSNDQDSIENVETVTKKTKVRSIGEGQEDVPSSSGQSANILPPTDLDTQLINLATELNFPFDSLLVTDQASKLPTDLTEIPQPSELDKNLQNEPRDPKLPSDNLLISSDDSNLSTFMTDTDYCLQSDDDKESVTKLENLLTDIIKFNSGKESEIGRLLDDQI